jgi:pilus assembly protein FimV
VAEPSFLDGLMDNPLLPAAGAGLIALLAGLGIYRARQRKQKTSSGSEFIESRLQPDSFFGGSGGQQVNTKERPSGSSSSMAYSPSQLDAAATWTRWPRPTCTWPTAATCRPRKSSRRPC